MERLRLDRLNPGHAALLAGEVPVVRRCHRTTTRPARLVGLLGTPDLARDEALWIAPCASVHTLFLRARIGCAFLDRDGRVLRVIDPLPAWRVAGCRGARAVVECAAGVLAGAGIAPGDPLRLGGPLAEMSARSGRTVTDRG